jgi:hypothetical protein
LIRKRKGQADLQKSLTSNLVDSFGLMGDRGYRGCEYVEVCESKEQKGIREMEERDYLTCLPLWLRHRLVAFSGSLKYGGNFSPDVFVLLYLRDEGHY